MKVKAIDENIYLKNKKVKLKDLAVKPTILYESTEGTEGDITLNDSINNYKYIEILYKQYQGYGDSCKIDLSVTKYATLTISAYMDSTIYIDTKTLKLNDKTISVIANYIGMVRIQNYTTISNQNNIKIYKVLGYKE